MKRTKAVLIVVMALAVCGFTGLTGPLAPSGSVLVVDLGGDIRETHPWSPLMSFLGGETPRTVLDKVAALDKAAEDGRIAGVVVRIWDAGYSMGKAQEFRSAILRYKETSGKPIYACLELEGGGNLEYYIASACDRVYLSPASTLGLSGLSMSRFYLGGLWEKIYLEVQVQQIAEYKSAADMMGRKDMSEAERRMDNAVLDSLYNLFLADMAHARGVDRSEVERWVDRAWGIPEKYEEAGAVDGIAYLSEVTSLFPKGSKAAVVSEKDYLEPYSRPGRGKRRPRLAVVYAVGNIVSGDQPEVPFMPRSFIASNPMVKELERAAEDDSIDAVILRVDSGGGSALASDLIWRATQKIRAKKPLVVSMSDVAGSGGYYISCGADRIVAQPGTITGSIGILTAHSPGESTRT